MVERSAEFPSSGMARSVVDTLSELRVRLGADLVWFGPLGLVASGLGTPPRLWWSALWAEGHAEAAHALQALGDRPVTGALGVDITLPSTTWHASIYTPEAKGFWTQSFARNVYLRNQLHEEHRLMISDSTGLQGVLAVVWGARRTGVVKRLSRNLRDGHARWAQERLLQTMRNMALSDPPSGFAIVSYLHGLQSASTDAAAWLAGGRTSRFLRAVERATRANPDKPVPLALDGAEIRLTTLQGEGGITWLAELRPLLRPRVERRVVLTPSQAVVVDLMLLGHSAPAIAAKLGKSVETVRSQIKQAYARLGVGNRLELAQAIGAVQA